MHKLKVLEFIKNNNNWRDILSSDSYNISIKEEDGLIILKYNQLCSDFSESIVRECRGLILYADTLKPACVPFYKFFNIGEEYADTIDWGTARVSEKMDGSLIKVFYRIDKQQWQISTNNNVDAFHCPIQASDVITRFSDLQFDNFGDLFIYAFSQNNKFNWFNELEKKYTYMFEICSPYNKIVIKYPNYCVWHIGTRNNETLEEVEVDIGVQKPKEYFFSSIQDCIEASQQLPSNQEGYVVRDAFYHRVKIKNPIYFLLHITINNNIITLSRIIELIKQNETGEFLAYFPEYKDFINEVIQDLNNISQYIHSEYDLIKRELGNKFSIKKEYAIIVMKRYKLFYDLFFKLYNDEEINLKDVLLSFPISRIEDTIKKWRKRSE